MVVYQNVVYNENVFQMLHMYTHNKVKSPKQTSFIALFCCIDFLNYYKLYISACVFIYIYLKSTIHLI